MGRLEKKFGLTVSFVCFLFLVVLSGSVSADTEPNDWFDTVEPITAGNYTGHLDESDEKDYYAITVKAGQKLSVKVTPDSTLGAGLALYNLDRASVETSGVKAYGGTERGVIRKVSLALGSAQPTYTYYIVVNRRTPSLLDDEKEKFEGTYTMEVTVEDQNDADSGGDAGDSFETASPISAGTHKGLLWGGDKEDYYKITLKPGQTISVNVTPSSTLAVSLTLYDEERKEEKRTPFVSGSDKGVIRRAERTTGSTLPSYTYYILVKAYWGIVTSPEGDYTMEVALTTPAVTTPVTTPTPTPSKTVRERVEETYPAITSIEPAKPVPITFHKTDITIININVTNIVYNIEVTVIVLPQKPADVPEAPGIVYSYLEVKAKNLEDKDMGSMEIEFKVDKSWIKEKNIDENSVKLNRYSKGKWNPLPTRKVREDEARIYYSATSPGLSVYGIVGGIVSPAVTTPTATAEKEVASEKKGICGPTAIAAIALLPFGLYRIYKRRD